MESLDLLFAKVGAVENHQEKIEAKFDVSTKLLEQMLLDQQTLAKQMEATGNAVAQLTLNQMRNRQERPPSPQSSESNEDIGFQQRRQYTAAGGGSGRAGMPPHRVPHRDRGGHMEQGRSKTFVPKMQFPTFVGDNRYIWKDKCENYFKIFNLPETMWPTIASMHMDDKAAVIAIN